MKDENLTQLLRGLPREKASEEFTAGVLRRLARQPALALAPPRSRNQRLLLAALPLLLILALAGSLWRAQVEQKANEAKLAELQALKQEAAAMAKELRTLRRLEAEASPTLYVGGSDDLGFVLDLSRLAGAEPSYRTRPVLVPARNPAARPPLRYATHEQPRRK